jgi:hypothetical protein
MSAMVIYRQLKKRSFTAPRDWLWQGFKRQRL